MTDDRIASGRFGHESLESAFFVEDVPKNSFLVRHEFLIRRLHSLSGLIPVGAYMVVHLFTNASVLAGTATFQGNVDKIHALGPLLPIVEWGFIFAPILFHAIFGVVIIAGGLPNTGSYPYARNIRYVLQRVTGIIAFIFIMYHIWHLHHYGAALGGGNFDPEAATSSTAVALQPFLAKLIYVVGMLSCVYHLANGLWTMGITWGVWTSPAAQRRANWVCAVFGVGLAIVGLSVIRGFDQVDIDEAVRTEQRLDQARDFATGSSHADAAVGTEAGGRPKDSGERGTGADRR